MNFGFVVFDQLEELDLVGPWEMAGMWSRVAEGPENRTIVSETMEPVRCTKGLVLHPHETFGTCPELDYLLVPGGHGTRAQAVNRVLLDFIGRQARGCRAVLSVCTGAFLLHAAGLLAGRKGTTHWGSRTEASCRPPRGTCGGTSPSTSSTC